MKDFKKNYSIVLIMAALFVAAIGVFSYTKFRESEARGERAELSHQILKDASDLRAVIFQELNDHKAFRTTNRTEDLKVYGADKEQASEIFKGLLSQVKGNDQQIIQLAEIKNDYSSLIRAIESQQYHKPVDDENVHRRINNTNKDINTFIENEDRIFSSRLTGLVALNQSFYIAIVVGSLAAFVILMAMNYYLLLAQHRQAVTQKQFEELKEKQAQSFRATRDGIFEWNFQEKEHAKIMYWSPRLKEMIGYKDNELKPGADRLEQMMHEDDRETFWQQLHRHLRGEVPEFSSFFRWRHKNGEWVWINARGAAVFNDAGEAVKLVGIHTDVTKLKEYELQLAKSKDDAEKANSAKSDFLAHMSHEIRTPLTAITGVAEILNLQKLKFDEKTQKLMAALNASAIGLRDLISDILDFSKIESGKIVLEQKEIDLRELFENLISIVSTRSSEKNLALICDYKAVDHIKIIGDKTRLRQILINLVGNAVKFTSKGSVILRAVPYVFDQREYLQIDIVDTGIGIADEQMPYIFDSFRQADASISRKYGGTGLGLPIAQQLVQMMGGHIHVESKLGEGSTFTVRVPLIRAAGEETQAEIKAIDLRKSVFNSEDKILIVEDYEGNIAFVTHILDEMGLKYDLGRTGLEGLKLWQENQYKMILMDIQMPEMDGISAVKHIRTIEKEKALVPVPIIAMTAHAFSEDKNKCLAAGFSAYLPKPLSKENLFEKMTELAAKAA